jgi:hypothetical protein
LYRYLIVCVLIDLYGRAQSVWRLATDWASGSELESRWSQEFSLLHVLQAGFGVHPTSYPMGTGDYFPGGKAAVA